MNPAEAGGFPWAKGVSSPSVGTEHILLGLLLEGDGIAAKVLKNLDFDIERCRQDVLRALDPKFQFPDPGWTGRI